MKTDDFDYFLPPDRIAQFPVEPRDSSKLLYLNVPRDQLQHSHFFDLPQILNPGDLVVLNDTRVMAARFLGFREKTNGVGAKVELLLLNRLEKSREWRALMRPARIARPGVRLVLEAKEGPLAATVLSREGDYVFVRLDRDIDLNNDGLLPFPRYIKNYVGENERYQTVYSHQPTSAAAPTAGLHFTPELIEELKSKGVHFSSITLDVGAATFLPVRGNDPNKHVLDAEHFELSPSTAEALNSAHRDGRRIVAVGTTVVRTLEFVLQKGWPIKAQEGHSDLFILPGHKFLAVNALITNFHLPRTSLMMLVAAFVGRDRLLDAYSEAIKENYRFYSFGDAMFIIPGNGES